jgi:hypothetical protein
MERCRAELHTEELANAQMTLRETPGAHPRDVRLQLAVLFPEFDPGGGVRQRIGEKGHAQIPVHTPVVVHERRKFLRRERAASIDLTVPRPERRSEQDSERCPSGNHSCAAPAFCGRG